MCADVTFEMSPGPRMSNLAQKVLLDKSLKWKIQKNLKAAINTSDYSTLEKILQTYGRQCQNFHINKDRDTALILATKYQDLTAIQLLFKYHAANPNKTNTFGSSALDVALLSASILTNQVDEILLILARITSQISPSVLTNVLDTTYQSVENVAHVAAFLTRHSANYSVRALLLHTLLTYYPLVIPAVVITHGSDPTGLTDRRIDPWRLWRQTNNLRYFKLRAGQLLSQELIILLIRSSNSKVSAHTMASVVLDSVQYINKEEKDLKFYEKALTLLTAAGHNFTEHHLQCVNQDLPEFVTWLRKQRQSTPNLQHLAKVAIRHSIQTNVLHGSKTLPIPATLQQYICLV